tara:strand:+ start:2143 stop:3219 length:1077 start_codon:yes stop_codon:yes gene_type:complete
MKILIVGSESRNYHLSSFSDELNKLGVESKVIIDTEHIEKTLSLNFKSRNDKKKKILQILKKFNPDTVMLDRISSIGQIILDEKIPLLLLLRGNYWEETELAKKTNDKSNLKFLSFYKNQKLADKIFSQATLVLPISKYLKNEFKKRFPETNCEVLYADGRKFSDWTHDKDEKISHPSVGLVQGFDIWGKTKELNTLQNVMKKLPNVTFYLAGDGLHKEKIIPKLEKFENFVWLGNEYYNDYPKKIKKFLSSIDVFLLLSGLEGLGQSIIEAMIMKKPVIASNVGGIPEIVKDSKTGFLVESGDSERIIFLINELLTKPSITTKIIENAKKDVEKFSWKTIAKEFFDILKEHKLNNII